MEFLDHGPLKGEKLQLRGRVVSFSLCQAPTGIDYDSISSTVMSLIEYILRLDSQASVWSLKGLENLHRPE